MKKFVRNHTAAKSAAKFEHSLQTQNPKVIPAPVLARISLSLQDGCLGARQEDMVPARHAHCHHHFTRKLRGPHNDRWDELTSAHKCNDRRDQSIERCLQRWSQPSHVPHAVLRRMRKHCLFVPNPKHRHTHSNTQWGMLILNPEVLPVCYSKPKTDHMAQSAWKLAVNWQRAVQRV